jgi:hypothetical protein
MIIFGYGGSFLSGDGAGPEWQLPHCGGYGEFSVRSRAQGLAAFRKNEWVDGIEERFGSVKVAVTDVRIEHEVKIADFSSWLERPGRTRREITERQRIRSILGLSVTR